MLLRMVFFSLSKITLRAAAGSIQSKPIHMNAELGGKKYMIGFEKNDEQMNSSLLFPR